MKRLFGRPTISFEPIKREIKKEVLFQNEVIAKEHFNFIYNHMIQSMLNYDEAGTKVLQEVLINYKLLSDNHGSKIKF